MAYARGLLGRKARQVAEAFADILDNDKPKVQVLTVDGGGEFKKEFSQMCQSRGITMERAEAYTHYKLSRTDRI